MIEKGDQFLMVRRPEKGLLAGLWEFPCAILPNDATSKVKSSIVESTVKELGVPNSAISGKTFIGEV